MAFDVGRLPFVRVLSAGQEPRGREFCSVNYRPRAARSQRNRSFYQEIANCGGAGRKREREIEKSGNIRRETKSENYEFSPSGKIHNLHIVYFNFNNFLF